MLLLILIMFPFHSIVCNTNKSNDVGTFILGYTRRDLDANDAFVSSEFVEIDEFLNSDKKIMDEHKKAIAEHLKINLDNYKFIINTIKIDTDDSRYDFYTLVSNEDSTRMIDYDEIKSTIDFMGGSIGISEGRLSQETLDKIKSDDTLVFGRQGKGFYITAADYDISSHYIVQQLISAINEKIIIETNLPVDKIPSQVINYLHTICQMKWMRLNDDGTSYYLLCPHEMTESQEKQYDRIVNAMYTRNKLNAALSQ